MEKTNIELLSQDEEYKAVKVLMEDGELMGSIYQVLDQNYFSNYNLRVIVGAIKEYYKENGRVPDYTTLKYICKSKVSADKIGDVVTAIISVKSSSSEGHDAAKEYLVKVFKTKEIVKLGNRIIDDVRKNESDDEIIKHAMKSIDKIAKLGKFEETEMTMTDENIRIALSSGDNETITTGIPELDTAMAGGLGRQEIGLFVAPTGYGKTTMATVLAHNAALAGYKVIQLYFEDKPNDIIRKHYAKLAGIKCDMLRELDEDEILKLMENTDRSDLDTLISNLRIVRMADGETTAEDIEEMIRRYINKGFRPDMITIDYFSSLKHSTNQYKNTFDAQARCMRKIKEIAYKYNIAVWMMQQTNRTAVSKDGDSKSMGNIQGSYKATQPCSVWLTLERTAEQKANCRATIVFNKTRHSQPKTDLENILFDNSRLDIRMDEHSGPSDEPIWDDSFQTSMARTVANNYNQFNQ